MFLFLMQKALLTLRYFSLCVPNIIFLRKEHLSFIGKALEEGKADRAGDFIKFLSEQQAVYGKLLDGKWFDIGTPESLKDAEEFFTP